MNVELLEKVIEHIDEEPRRLFMEEWIVSSENLPDYIKQDHLPPCGTAACIAGMAVLLTEGAIAKIDSSGLKAGTILHLNRDESLRLFILQEWPSTFRYEYQAAETPRERADITIDRIRHFIATNGEE